MVDLDNRWWTVLFSAWGANLINRRCTFHLLGQSRDLCLISTPCLFCVCGTSVIRHTATLFWFIVNKMNVGPITTITLFKLLSRTMRALLSSG